MILSATAATAPGSNSVAAGLSQDLGSEVCWSFRVCRARLGQTRNPLRFHRVLVVRKKGAHVEQGRVLSELAGRLSLPSGC